MLNHDFPQIGISYFDINKMEGEADSKVLLTNPEGLYSQKGNEVRIGQLCYLRRNWESVFNDVRFKRTGFFKGQLLWLNHSSKSLPA
jgi:hypothetical protein